MGVRDINIKNHTYYNIKDFRTNNIRVDKRSYKSILICYIAYVTIKKDMKIYSVNPLYL